VVKAAPGVGPNFATLRDRHIPGSCLEHLIELACLARFVKA
jgi:hypothetical protein